MFPALAQLLHLTKAVHPRRAPGAVVPEVSARTEGLIVETEGEFANTTAHSFTQRPGRRRTLLGVGLGHLDAAAGHGDHHRPLLGLCDVEQLQRGVETGDVMIVNSLRLRLVDAGQEEGEGPNGAEQVSWGQLCVVGEHVGQVLE